MANIYDRLLNKMNREYDEFVDNLKTKNADTIVSNAYEIVIKKEMLFQMESLNTDDYQWLNEESAEALCKEKHPLDACYERWLKLDGADFSEDVRLCVEKEGHFISEKSKHKEIKRKTDELEM
ncbi:DUF3848 domain-containing protein [Anaerofustis stercorihominis]|uniref:DUF3848 domain-containing protein n=1 Tax=Anaerofustis stercorihominis TaxID=214853 RepID=UPI0039842FCA